MSTAPELTAERFAEILTSYSDEAEREKITRYFKSGKGQYGEGDLFIGVKMGQVFNLAKEFIGMDIGEIEKLLDNPIHEIKAGGLSIMDKQARSKKTPVSRRKELYDLYMRRHDRINNWDLVDLAAIHVVGGYLFDKPRDILYQMALSQNMWERRTAIVSTAYFVRQGEVNDTFNIAEMLVMDKEDLIQKAYGGWVREAGKSKHRQQLVDFLDRYAATMPRTALRYAIEHMDDAQRQYYMNLKTK